MENVTVVVAVLRVNAKVFDSFGAFFAEEFHVDVAFGGVDHGVLVNALRC